MIRATVQLARAKAAVAFNRAIISDIQLGKFIRFLTQIFSDSASAADSPSLNAAKNLADSSVAAEAVALGATKQLSDDYAVSESAILTAAKALQDQASLTDGERRAFEKAIQDEPSITESQVFAIVKALEDGVNATDDVDGADLDDEQNIRFFKVTSDLAAATENIELVADFVRAFSDAGAITDVDVAGIGKFLADEAVIDDPLSFSVAISRADIGLAAEQAVLGLSKALTDTGSVTEAISIAIDFVRSLSDTSVAIEDLSVSIGKSLGDSASVTEVIQLVLSIPVILSDSLAASEGSVFDIIKKAQDGAEIAEQIAQEITKSIADASLVNDLPSLEYATAFDNASSMVDGQIKSPGKIETDASTVADTGSLRSQGYCEFSYFAEDYVGESRTFT